MGKKNKGCLLKVVGAVIVLVLLTPFIVTSSLFIESVILPKVSEATGCEISAEVDISLVDSEIVISQLKVEKGDDLSVSGERIFCSYSLGDLLGGEVSVSKLDLESVAIRLKQQAEPQAVENSSSGQSDNVVSAEEGSEDTTGTIRLNIRDVSLSDLNVTYETLKGETIALKDFSFMLDQLKPGFKSTISYLGQVDVNYGSAMTFSSSQFSGSISSNLGQDLMPGNTSVKIGLEKLKGSIQEQSVDGRSILLNSSVELQNNAYSIKECLLTESRGDTIDSKVTVAGSIALEPLSADLEIAALPISTQMLNLAGSFAGGYSFGKSQLYYRGGVTFKANSNADFNGKLIVKNGSVVMPGSGLIGLPPLQLSLEYEAGIDLDNNELKLSKCSLRADHSKGSLLELDLSEPAQLSLDKGNASFTGSNPRVTARINKFPTKIIKTFIPDTLPLTLRSGELSVNSIVTVDQGGRAINVQALSEFDNASAVYDQLDLSDIGIKNDFAAQIVDMSKVTIQRFTTTIRQGRQDAAALQVSGNYDIAAQTGEATTKFVVENNRLVQTVVNQYNTDPQIRALVNQLSKAQIDLFSKSSFDLSKSVALVKSLKLGAKIKNKKVVALRSVKPLEIAYSKPIDPAALPASLELIVDGFELSTLNPLLAESKIAFPEGTASAQYAITNSKSGLLAAKGTLALQNLRVQTDKGMSQNISLKCGTDVSLKNVSDLTLNGAKLKITSAGQELADLSTSGEYSLKSKKGTFNYTITQIDDALIARLGTLAPELPLETFSLLGKGTASLNGQAGKTLLTGKAFARKFQFKKNSGFKSSESYNAAVSYNIEAAGQTVTLNRMKVQLQNKGDIILDSSLSGTMPIDISQGIANLQLDSDIVDVKRLLAMTESAPPAEQGTTYSRGATRASYSHYESQIPSIEEPSVDLGGLDMRLAVDLKKISYGSMVNRLKGDVKIQDNVISTNDLLLSLDGSPLTINSRTDLGAAGGMDYYLDANGVDISLANLIHEIAPSRFKSSFTFSDFAFAVKGKGIRHHNIVRSLNYSHKFAMKDISVPFDLKDKVLANIPKRGFWAIGGLFADSVFVTAETVGTFVSKLPGSYGQSADSLIRSINGEKNLELAEGHSVVNVKNGLAQIKSLHFGGKDLKGMDLTGTVGMDGTRDLDASLDLGVLIIPVALGREVKITKTIEELIGRNIKNFVEGVADSPQDLLDIITDKKKRKRAIDQFIKGGEQDDQKKQPSQPQSDKSQEEPDERDLGKQVLDNVLDNIFRKKKRPKQQGQPGDKQTEPQKEQPPPAKKKDPREELIDNVLDLF